MFYIKPQTSEKPTANHSHLHKVTSPTAPKPNFAPAQSQIPRKQVFGKVPVAGTDVSIDTSVVNSFLQAVNASNGQNGQNGPVRNSSHLFKPQISPKTPPAQCEFNHLGLRKVNSTESPVANKVKCFNKETVQNRESDEHVTLRPKISAEKPKKELFERSSSQEEKRWRTRYEDAEKKRKEMLAESQKGKFLSFGGEISLKGYQHCVGSLEV